jgi:hypothetical protein
VDDAAKVLESTGEAAFRDFSVTGSRWRHAETYIFVLDLDGRMLVHPDQALQGGNALQLTDVNGRPIIRGLLAAATASSGKTDGWYHYQWPVPGEILPRWKSSYVRLVVAPSGQRYVVGSGMYTERMEPAFVVDMVTDAVGQIEDLGRRGVHGGGGPALDTLVRRGRPDASERSGHRDLHRQVLRGLSAPPRA